MGKRIVNIIAIIGGLSLLYFILSITNVFKVFTNQTTANEPNLKANSKVIASSIPTPKAGDFICYKIGDSLVGGFYLQRLIATPGDTLEVKEGYAYVNGKNTDLNRRLYFGYTLTRAVHDSLVENTDFEADVSFIFSTQEETITYMEPKQAQQYGLKRKIDSVGATNKDILRIHNKNWNKDYFGPLIIPEDSYFVMGDNRDNTYDSRFAGLISKSNFVSVVIWP